MKRSPNSDQISLLLTRPSLSNSAKPLWTTLPTTKPPANSLRFNRQITIAISMDTYCITGQPRMISFRTLHELDQRKISWHYLTHIYPSHEDCPIRFHGTPSLVIQLDVTISFYPIHPNKLVITIPVRDAEKRIIYHYLVAPTVRHQQFWKSEISTMRTYHRHFSDESAFTAPWHMIHKSNDSLIPKIATTGIVREILGTINLMEDKLLAYLQCQNKSRQPAAATHPGVLIGHLQRCIAAMQGSLEELIQVANLDNSFKQNSARNDEENNAEAWSHLILGGSVD